jgi:hypothetical protein
MIGLPTTTKTISCQKLIVNSITTKDNDGHIPANVLDNNLIPDQFLVPI